MRSFQIFFVVMLCYGGGYLFFRQSNQEIWQKNNQTYVVFPTSMRSLYYLWRPLTYADSTLTGMKFHIGRHH